MLFFAILWCVYTSLMSMDANHLPKIQLSRPANTLNPHSSESPTPVLHTLDQQEEELNIEILLEKTADAIRKNNIKTLQDIIKNNPSIPHTTDARKMTLLMLAAKQKNIAACKILLECGSNIHDKDITEKTASIHAALALGYNPSDNEFFDYLYKISHEDVTALRKNDISLAGHQLIMRYLNDVNLIMNTPQRLPGHQQASLHPHGKK